MFNYLSYIEKKGGMREFVVFHNSTRQLILYSDYFIIAMFNIKTGCMLLVQDLGNAYSD